MNKTNIVSKPPVSPVETVKRKTGIYREEYKKLLNRYLLASNKGKIEMLREIQSKYPKNLVEYGKIEKQIEGLSG